MIKLIIFDYDGVIVDSSPNVHDVYRIMCKKLGKSCPEDFAEFKKIYGHSSSEGYANLNFSTEEIIQGNRIFKKEILKKQPRPFEGIIEVLEKLHKGYKLVLISSNHREEVEQKLRNLEILKKFDFIIAREDSIGRFEKTESIKKVMADLSLLPEEILLIGDRNVDFIEGSNAGLKNIILVDYGWGYDVNKIPEYKQKYSIKTPRDILEAIKEF